MFAEIFISLALAQLSNCASWSYSGETGPENWGNEYADCNGNSQSPIDIPTASATYDNDLPPLDRQYLYNPPNGMTVLNNGHAIQVNLDNGYTINDDKLLPFSAKAAQYHFHWGTATADTYTNGSEHTVDGMQYFGELHVVHYNTKYSNLNVAINKPDGLAVFGWFISVTYPQTNLDIGNLLDLAEQLASKKDDKGAITARFSVETLIPPNTAEYYRYKGSLTTPGCYESVVWTVFKEPIEITQEQAFQLASKFLSNNVSSSDAIVNNFRPVQELNGRSVTMPRPLVQSNAATATTAPQIISALLALVVSMISLH